MTERKSIWVIEEQETSEGWYFVEAFPTSESAKEARDIYVANSEQMQFRIIRYDAVRRP